MYFLAVLMSSGLSFECLWSMWLFIFNFIFDLLVLWRIDVFGDNDSVIIDEDNEKYGIGYMPLYYMLVYFFIIGKEFLALKTYNLFFIRKIIILALIIIFLGILLYPDKINEVLPFNIRTRNGGVMFLFGIIVIFMILLSITQLLFV